MHFLNLWRYNRAEVKRYTKGFGPGNYECFSSVFAARRAWSEALTKHAWGVPGLLIRGEDDSNNNNNDDNDDDVPLVMPV